MLELVVIVGGVASNPCICTLQYVALKSCSYVGVENLRTGHRILKSDILDKKNSRNVVQKERK